jgi:hypothetical protein
MWIIALLSMSDYGSGEPTALIKTCENENPGFEFPSGFPCREWRNCEHECYITYRYPFSKCAELIEACPICCIRPPLLWWVPIVYISVFLFILFVVVALSVRYTTDAYKADNGIVYLWPWFWLWFIPWFSWGSIGRGRGRI